MGNRKTPESGSKENSRVRRNLDLRLTELQDKVLLLGSLVQKSVQDSVQALQEQDLGKAKEILAQNGLFRHKRNSIEADALTLISTQHPVAGDLRTLVAVLEIATELERMGRYTEEISQMALMIGVKPEPNPVPLIPEMAQRVMEMFFQALGAFARRDLELARAIPAQDDEVDALYRRVHQSLTSLKDRNTNWDNQFRLLRVAHNLERVGDRVTNICEWVIFAITGELLELN